MFTIGFLIYLILLFITEVHKHTSGPGAGVASLRHEGTKQNLLLSANAPISKISRDNPVQFLKFLEGCNR